MRQWYREEQETVTPVPLPTVNTPVQQVEVPKQPVLEQVFDRATFDRATKIAVSLQIDEHFGKSETVSMVQPVTAVRPRLSRMRGAVLFGLPAFYTLFMTVFSVVFDKTNTANNLLTSSQLQWITFTVMVLPALLMFLGGGMLRRVRQTALLGVLMSSAFLMGIGLSALFGVDVGPTASIAFVVAFLLPWGALFGALVGAAAKAIANYRNTPDWTEEMVEAGSE